MISGLFLICMMQFLAQPDQRMFNTANAGVPFNSYIPLLTFPDLNWKVSLNGISGTYNNAYRVAPVAGWATPGVNPNHAWITPTFACIPNDPANHGCVGTGITNLHLYYRVQFTLPANPVYAVNWTIWADNIVADIYVNNLSTPVVSPNAGTFNTPYNFRHCSNWVTGLNTIIIHVVSGPYFPPTSNWCGLMIKSLPNAINISGPSMVCPSSNNQYSIAPVGGASNYSWVLPVGWTGISPTNVISTTAPSSSGSGLIKVTVSNGSSCLGAASLPVTVLAAPNVNISASALTVCPGTPVTLTASGALNYNWSSGGTGNQKTVTPLVTTTYFVTGTDSNGCTKTSQITITVLPAPNITINTAPSIICSGIPNVLTASGANSYIWSSASPITNPNTNVITVTPSGGPATYNVVGTGLNGCTGSAAVTLNSGNVILPMVNTVTLCTNANTCAVLSASTTFSAGPVNYTWQQPNGGLNLTGATVNVCPNPLVTGVYTITANSPNGCAGSATTAVIVTTNCCSQSTAGLLPITSLSGNYSNTSYFLENTITLTNNTTFQSAEVLIMPNVQIIVPSGLVLNLDGAHLFACGINMWDGIVVQDGGRVITSNSRKLNSMIEDAKVGIDLDGISLTNSNPNPPIDIEGVVFNKNYIGIKISNSVPTLNTLALGINGCVFSSRQMPFGTYPLTLMWPSSDMILTTGLRYTTSSALSGLTPPYALLNYMQSNLKSPYNNQPGHIGIKINNLGDPNGIVPNVGVDIGLTYPGSITNNFNLFDGLGKGIEVTNASLTTHRNTFQNTQVYNTGNGSFGGMGIHVTITNLMNTKLNLVPTTPSTSFGNRFWNCNVGVFADNAFEVMVAYGTFRSTQDINNPSVPIGSSGVSLYSNRCKYSIEKNEFNNIRWGLWIGTKSGPYNMGAGVSNGTYADAINVKENYFGADVNSINILNTNYCNRAITFNGTSGSNWSIVGTCNIVSNKINRAFRGIDLFKTDNYPIEVGGNEIRIIDDNLFEPWPFNMQFGISAKNSLGNLFINQNNVTGAGLFNTNMKGIYSYDNQSNSGPNTSPIITCNNIDSAYVGFEFELSQKNTMWRGNLMKQPMERGLALVSQAEIGIQGSLTQACADRWVDAVTDIWPNHCQTYVGPATNAFPGTLLWCEQPYIGLPIFNCNAPGALPFIAGGPQSSVESALMGADCLFPTVYSPVPSQRTNQTPSHLKTDEINRLNTITIYPNPSKGLLNLIDTNLGNDELNISIIDVNGKVVYKRSIKGKDGLYHLDVPFLQASIYLVTIQNMNGNVTRTKLIIEN